MDREYNITRLIMRFLALSWNPRACPLLCSQELGAVSCHDTLAPYSLDVCNKLSLIPVRYRAQIGVRLRLSSAVCLFGAFLSFSPKSERYIISYHFSHGPLVACKIQNGAALSVNKELHAEVLYRCPSALTRRSANS
jgi:hypothetical protein